METLPQKFTVHDEHTTAHVAELRRAFCDTSRLRLLSYLVAQELKVGTLARMMGISESVDSHHLRGLRQMGVVKARRSGKEVHFRIEDEHILALFRQVVDHVWQQRSTSEV